ncbi:MAG: methanol dehydrogenase [Deltaproteobacteria bacterium SG8_13]|nr:MAG: methanol dehydrogenase [Deltaproteobacteria bacterium SG8_13]
MRPRPIPATLLAVVFALLASRAAALDVPPLQGRVNDTAGILSPATERQLDAVLKDLEQTDSTQIVVLTVPSLQGENLEEFSIRVAEKWQIGQKGLDNGALLLIAKKERKLRIEVGYGLEGRLTDLVSGRIIRNVIVPRFREGSFDQGVADGVAAMIGVVKGEFTPPQQARRRPEGEGSGFPRGLFALFAFLFLINMLGRLRRGMGAVAGGIIAPIVGAVFFHAGLLWLLLLIPLGLVAGFLLSLMGGPLTFGHRSGTIGYWGGGGGGFSSGGGFSGGGGGFGGGGASGGW